MWCLKQLILFFAIIFNLISWVFKLFGIILTFVLKMIFLPILIVTKFVNIYILKPSKKNPFLNHKQYSDRIKSYNKVKKMEDINQMTLVLDLDETLVYCSHKKFESFEK